MKYNPQIHHRRNIRLKGNDYSQAGAYFITIDCKDMVCRFGKIENAEMKLNEYGMVAYNEWAKLPARFENVELDVFQIMPNHMHGIVVLKPIVGAGFTPALSAHTQPLIMQPQPMNGERMINQSMINKPMGGEPMIGEPMNNQPLNGEPMGDDNATTVGATPRVAPTVIGDIVGAYKSWVVNACIVICNSQHIRLGKLWQRNYYEHIIRNEQSYKKISDYIINNPARWENDKFYIS